METLLPVKGDPIEVRNNWKVSTVLENTKRKILSVLKLIPRVYLISTKPR